MQNKHALYWIARAGKKEIAEVEALGLTDEQAFTLARWFMDNPVLSPGKRNKAKERQGLFMCLCGCNKLFRATWKTRPPRYVNNAHKCKAYRLRKGAPLNLKNAQVKIALSAVNYYTDALIGQAKKEYLMWYRIQNDAIYRSQAASVAAHTRWNYWEKLRRKQERELRGLPDLEDIDAEYDDED